jgi:hypothetical protein
LQNAETRIRPGLASPTTSVTNCTCFKTQPTNGLELSELGPRPLTLRGIFVYCFPLFLFFFFFVLFSFLHFHLSPRLLPVRSIGLSSNSQSEKTVSFAFQSPAQGPSSSARSSGWPSGWSTGCRGGEMENGPNCGEIVQGCSSCLPRGCRCAKLDRGRAGRRHRG